MKTKTVSQLKEEKNLQAMVEADKQQRADGFKAYLEEGLKKFNCKIDPVVVIVGNVIQPSLNVTAL